jgi:hypothetical protein
MFLKDILERLTIFDKTSTIYLNADGTLLTLPERLSKRGRPHAEHVMGQHYSCLFTEREEDRPLFNDLLKIAEKKGSVSRTMPANHAENVKRLKLNAVKNDVGDVLGFTMTEYLQRW